MGRSDTLTRGGLPTRTLSSIAELEPFFPDDPDGPTTIPRPEGGLPEPRPPVPSIHRQEEDDDFEEATIPRVSAGTDRSLPPAHDLLGEEPGFEPPTARPSPAEPEAPTQEVRASEAGVRAPDKVVIREAGGNVIGITSIGNRNPDNPFDLPFRSLVRFDFPVYQPDDCPLCREGVELVKPGSRKQVL